MALTTKQKHRAIFHLGWSAQTLVEGSTQFNSVVNDRISFDNAEFDRIAKDLIECIDKVDEQLKEAQCRAATSKVDNITLNKDEIYILKKEKRRLIRELSDHTDIPIMKKGGNLGARV